MIAQPAPTTTNTSVPFHSHVLLDGTQVLIRPLAPDDKEAERAFIKGLSGDACRFRFRGAIHEPSEQLLEQLTRIDPEHGIAFAAVVTGADGADQLIGVARYATDADKLHCECAVAVADGWQHRGLGTLLMRDLIAVAKANGIRWMRSVDSAANTAMWELATYLGFHTRRNPDDPTEVIHELDLT